MVPDNLGSSTIVFDALQLFLSHHCLQCHHQWESISLAVHPITEASSEQHCVPILQQGAVFPLQQVWQHERLQWAAVPCTKQLS